MLRSTPVIWTFQYPSTRLSLSHCLSALKRRTRFKFQYSNIPAEIAPELDRETLGERRGQVMMRTPIPLNEHEPRVKPKVLTIPCRIPFSIRDKPWASFRESEVLLVQKPHTNSHLFSSGICQLKLLSAHFVVIPSEHRTVATKRIFV